MKDSKWTARERERERDALNRFISFFLATPPKNASPDIDDYNILEVPVHPDLQRSVNRCVFVH